MRRDSGARTRIGPTYIVILPNRGRPRFVIRTQLPRMTLLFRRRAMTTGSNSCDLVFAPADPLPRLSAAQRTALEKLAVGAPFNEAAPGGRGQPLLVGIPGSTEKSRGLDRQRDRRSGSWSVSIGLPGWPKAAEITGGFIGVTAAPAWRRNSQVDLAVIPGLGPLAGGDRLHEPDRLDQLAVVRVPVFRLGRCHLQQGQVRIVQALGEPRLEHRVP